MLLKRKERLTHYGKLARCKTVTINSNSYLVQEFSFKTYNKAHSKYFKIVSELEKDNPFLETKYDLYDWSYSFSRYKAYTIAIKYYRSYNSIQIVKSHHPMAIATLEEDNPFFNYTNKS